MKKRNKIIILVASFLIAIVVIVYFAVGNYFYEYALNAKDEKEFMDDNPHLEESIAVNADVAEAAELADAKFKEQHPSTSMSIVSNDKLKLNLEADLYENDDADGQKWAIVVHGYTSKAANMTRYVRNFYEQGYNVLAPDLRGHGDSEGDYIGMGWHDRLDLLQWIDEVIKLDANAEIVLFGVSMGGATVMMASGEELPSNVKVIVEDCGYSSVSEVFTYQLDDLFGLPEFPIINAASTVANFRAGYDLYEASAVKQVAKSKTPMLFIHGDADTFVPFEMLDKVYEAANVEKDKLIIAEAGHADSEKVNPELYWNTVWGFVGKYIQ
ncbi:Serine aminopeptidase S33 domain-containing protein OS=Ureibacillus acetophenoni OX=614649 GN=SAMN05877842_10712 PE=4 SV=1 [Ureibacillus acetophenoni]